MSKTPKLCKQGNLAYVRIHGRKLYLGIHGTAEAQREYHRVIAEYHANASEPPKDAKSVTLDELCLRFLEDRKNKITPSQWDIYRNLMLLQKIKPKNGSGQNGKGKLRVD